ncbi:MAG: Sec-independent protein translocase protein TatB [Gammaproteobacteria bacterium]|nr:Sec-independent protein translocase protein TatB [Gammaproteobacteria bacterium]MBT8133993.1 Sec-independent protein translocase protein TatB [Gammaproteobacteria bacterium]NNJ51013.1 twin-arginine translocase subunit TatB [Gammaproteobacteria bacterium]
MFDVGFWEILLILVLALVVIGPERLPGAARQAGFWVGKARRYIEGVRSEVEEELDVSEFKRMLHNQEVQINELQQQIKSSVDNVGSEISKDNPSSEILSDVPAHTFQDEKPDEVAGSDEIKKPSKADEEKS